MDARQPVAEGEALVACKSPSLARGGQVQRDGRPKDHGQGKHCQTDHTPWGDRLAKDPEKGIPVRLIQSIVDRCNTKEVYEKDDKTENTIKYIASDHGAGHGESRISNFFREMCCSIRACDPS